VSQAAGGGLEKTGACPKRIVKRGATGLGDREVGIDESLPAIRRAVIGRVARDLSSSAAS